MKRIKLLLALVLFTCQSMSLQAKNIVTLFAGNDSGQMQFAVSEIQTALNEKGQEFVFLPVSQISQLKSGEYNIILLNTSDENNSQLLKEVKTDRIQELKKEGFIIQKSGENEKTIWVLGMDDTGVMYGGLEVAEIIKLEGLNFVENDRQNPHLERRGIKINIPLDARTPSYADAGTAAQENITEMWSMDFWKNHLDNLARHRYNAITLWNLHHFPSMVKVPEYPDIALDDVKRSTINFKDFSYGYDGFQNYHLHGTNMYNERIVSNLETVKVMKMDEKIRFWQDVMQYGKDRGIDFYLITWNVFVSSAQDAGYGITADNDNPVTVNYMRKSVKVLFDTYPLLAGIGVSAGENLPDKKEEWLWDTYGMGVIDAQNSNPNREIEFIHRHWWADMDEIKRKFKFNDDVQFNFSYKYARARLYSHTNPDFIGGLVNELPEGSRFWLNLRNDDIFNFRWGDASYVRDFIKNMPPTDKITGFQMGSDGYVWGREFTSTEPETVRQLEIEKHWYKYLLWGRLGYNPDIPDARFEKLIANKYPKVNPTHLMDVWAVASKIIPAVNRAHWHNWDFQWAVEYCTSRYKGFHGILECDWGDAKAAEELKEYADYVLGKINYFRSPNGKELRLTLGDMEAMAHLGNYYAEKILAAVHAESNTPKAIEHARQAALHWRKYAAVASSQYKPQLLGRAGWADWKEIYYDVLEEIVRLEGKSDVASIAPTHGGTILEAEEAELFNVSAENSTSGFTGTGYVKSGVGKAIIEWTFDAPENGEYILEFRYAFSNGSNTPEVLVNGVDTGAVNLWTTGSSDTWAWDRKAVKLVKGKNKISLNCEEIDARIDHLNIIY